MRRPGGTLTPTNPDTIYMSLYSAIYPTPAIYSSKVCTAAEQAAPFLVMV